MRRCALMDEMPDLAGASSNIPACTGGKQKRAMPPRALRTYLEAAEGWDQYPCSRMAGGGYRFAEGGRGVACRTIDPKERIKRRGRRRSVL